MAIGAQFAAALQALLKKLQQDQMDIDYKEQARRRLFAQQEAGQMEAYPMALRASNEGFADRGLVQSGINLNRQGEINRGHLSLLQGFNDTLSNDLRGFARDRLNAQSNYDLGEADLQRQDAAANAQKMIQLGKGYHAVAPKAPVAAKAVAKPAAAVLPGLNPGSSRNIPVTPKPKAPVSVKAISKRKGGVASY